MMDEKQREALAGKKVAELQTMAVEMGLAGKGLKKAQLIDAILTGPPAGGTVGGGGLCRRGGA